ncbi:MAG: hypothetical protein JNL11_17040 [Bdellovibrionaceae bacterium]|nr:hypothetical protein [Pseudobdellovibrionaceae bacterium]
MELITADDANSFKLRTIRGNGYQELSRPMHCSLTTSDSIFISAECTQSILNIKFSKNVSGLFSITHEMIIPGKPELKDPTAGSYGDRFDCRGEKQ